MVFRNSYRIPIGFLIGLVFLYRAQPTISSFIAGALFMIIGEALRFISAGTLIKFEGVTSHGIYAYTRNPLYIGSFLMGTGACIMGRDPFFTVGFFMIYIWYYLRVIKREEAHLITRYGPDYRKYISEVPRIIPTQLDFRRILSSFSVYLALKNKEGNAILGIAGVWIILAAKISLI